MQLSKIIIHRFSLYTLMTMWLVSVLSVWNNIYHIMTLSIIIDDNFMTCVFLEKNCAYVPQKRQLYHNDDELFIIFFDSKWCEEAIGNKLMFTFFWKHLFYLKVPSNKDVRHMFPVEYSNGMVFKNGKFSKFSTVYS